jgi:hypothetical protein
MKRRLNPLGQESGDPLATAIVKSAELLVGDVFLLHASSLLRRRIQLFDGSGLPPAAESVAPRDLRDSPNCVCVGTLGS